jgi:microcystin-dependent protein
VQGNAATAWVNNCRMSLTKQLGRALAVAGSGSGLTTRTLGRVDGAETHTQSLTEMVAHNHGFSGFNAITTDTSISTFGPGGVAFYSTTSNVSATNTVGSGGPMNVLNPRSYWNVMIKL